MSLRKQRKGEIITQKRLKMMQQISARAEPTHLQSELANEANYESSNERLSVLEERIAVVAPRLSEPGLSLVEKV